MARYKDRMLERCYVEFQKFALDQNNELYFRTRDGRLVRRSGALHRNAFWHGFDGVKAHGRRNFYPVGSQTHVIYMAAREFAKTAPGWVPRS